MENKQILIFIGICLVLTLFVFYQVYIIGFTNGYEYALQIESIKEDQILDYFNLTLNKTN